MLATDTIRPIFSNIILPAILIAAPILTLGILSFKGLSVEFDSREASRYQQRQLILNEVSDKIINEQINNSRKIIDHIHFTIGEETTQDARNFADDGNLLFYSIYQNNSRLFPSMESTSTMHTERFYLNILANSIRLAFASFQNNSLYHEQLSLSGQDQSTAFVCEQKKEDKTICVLLSSNFTSEITHQSLSHFSQSNESWSITPLEHNAESFLATANSYTTRLPPPLHNISINIKSKPGILNFASTFTNIVIIGLPLLALWALLIGFVYKHQHQKVTENRRRSQTAAQLAHDLRTPLANLSLYTELLYRNANNEQSVRRYAEVIQQETGHLNKLGERTIRAAQGFPEPGDYSKIVPLHNIQDLVKRSSRLIKSEGCYVVVSGTADQPVLVDIVSLESITLQLIQNALKHAQSTQIDIHISVENKLLKLQVRDYGKGVPEQLIKQIFNSGVSTGTGSDQGYGLGLSGIRHQARLHGGDAFCENCLPGAQFTITLKIKQAS